MSDIYRSAMELGAILSKADPAALAPGIVGSPFVAQKVNPAESTCKRLSAFIMEFEAKLDQDHEIGARLVSFGSAVEFHIEDIGYRGFDIITFTGINKAGERVQLIQNISQLSVLLIAMKKAGEKPRRIGFVLPEEMT
jgi:uncharacterized protein DUF6173